MWCKFSFILLLSFTDAKNLGVISGDPADIKDFPYMVQVHNLWGLRGDGSILDENTILTTGRHVQENLYILYGNTQLGRGERINISKIITHEKIEFAHFHNNIALLVLETPIKFSETAQPIKLPKPGERTPENKTAVLSGWGSQRADVVVYPGVLEKADLQILSDADCLRSDPALDPRIQLCTSSNWHFFSKGPGKRDNGAPLVLDGVQYGLYASHTRIHDDKLYYVYTKISGYIDWIDEHLR